MRYILLRGGLVLPLLSLVTANSVCANYDVGIEGQWDWQNIFGGPVMRGRMQVHMWMARTSLTYISAF